MENSKTKKTVKEIKTLEAKKNTDKFKDDYFRYYDDVKSHTHKIIDW